MFKKYILAIWLLLFSLSPCLAANYYVDTNCGDNGDGTWDSSGDGCDDNGGATDGAWNNLADTMELATFTAGDKIWIRRTSGFDQDVAAHGDIDFADDGTAAAPIYWIGYPRASKAINCDWVNGDATVDNVDGNDLDRAHLGRYVTGPDGHDYLITIITDANTFEIDREYPGTTAANEDVTIKADEDYTEAAALEGGEVLTDWGGDANELPVIDMGDENNQVTLNGDNWNSIRNIDFIDGTDMGILKIYNSLGTELLGCLFHQTTQPDPCINFDRGEGFLKRIIVTGPGNTACLILINSN